MLTVAHRLNAIIDSDVAVVMDGGRFVEFGKSFDLMTKEESAFRRL